MGVDNVYSSDNPLVTDEDIKDHFGVGAVIHNKKNEILVLHHTKYNFWTIPIGKVEKGNDINVGMIKEVKEELGVDVIRFNIIGTFNKTYDRGNGIQTHIMCALFDVVSFLGEIRNKEPHKHSTMVWMGMKELQNMDPNSLSDLTKFYIMLKTQILNSPVRKICSEST